MKENTFKGILGFQEAIKVYLQSDTKMWFRGQEHVFEGIRPGIYRNNATVSPNFTEEVIVNEFIIQSPPVLQKIPRDGWEWICLMQHHKLPTRLVDWSESYLQALFFALINWDTNDLKQTPVVYILDANSLNKYTIDESSPLFFWGAKYINWLPNTIRFISGELDFSKPKIEPLSLKAYGPIAGYVQYTNGRIAHQRGCFTLHGEYSDSLETYETSSGIEFISKLTLDLTGQEDSNSRKKIKETLLDELDHMGFNEFTAYRDIDHLSLYIKRTMF